MVLLVQSLRLTSFATFRLASSLPFLCKQNGRRSGITFVRRNTHNLSSAVKEFFHGVSDFEPDEVHDNGEAAKKDAALRSAITELAGEFGKESMLSLQKFFRCRNAPVIPTGSLKLDLALGIGGLPKGRMVEIFGREASGKTTLALHVIKEAQKLGGYCAYLDVENALDPSLAQSIGVKMESLLISPPDFAENLLSMVDTLIKSGSVDVIVVDSVAALLPQCEHATPIGGTYRDEQSRIMTKALRKIHYSLCESHTLIIFLNQVRSSVKPGQGFGHAEDVTCGGNALKFYSAIRLKMIRTGLLKTKDKATGLGVCVQVEKNKLAPAMKKADLRIEFGGGFSRESEVLELACEHGVIMKEGSDYVINGEVFSDEQEAEEYLAKNEEVLDNIAETVRRQLFERKR